MYCSTCGVAIAQGLSYCNYCGAKLGGTTQAEVSDTPHVKPELLVSAMVAVFVLGLGAVIVLMGVMKTVLDLPVEAIFAAAVFCFLFMLSLEAVFLRLLFRRQPKPEKANNRELSKGQPTKELDSTPARVLPPAMASVTEHTTRTFDQVPIERQKQ